MFCHPHAGEAGPLGRIGEGEHFRVSVPPGEVDLGRESVEDGERAELHAAGNRRGP